MAPPPVLRAHETLAGRAFGELDPNDPHNTIITDIRLAPRNANGKVEYMATFFLVKPIDMSRSSHLMWQDVPNRGGRITICASERNKGDIGLSSGWQGDNIGRNRAELPEHERTMTWSSRREESGRVADHRPRHRPHLQRERRRFAADDRVSNPCLTSPRARHHEGDADTRMPPKAWTA